MFIDERVFNDLQVVKESSFDDYRSDDEWSDEYREVLYQFAEKEMEDYKDDYETEEDWEDVVNEEAENILRICRFNTEGVLSQALQEWYGSYEVMIEIIRSAVDYDGYIYYVTGIGYDTIGTSLLNGSPVGKARYKFIADINKDNEDKQRVENYERMAK